jgi:RNA polymerase sigma-70 factor (ECF subfamily)
MSWPRRPVVRRTFADAAADHLDDVVRYLTFMTGDPSVAEDLAAETFEKALRAWRRFDPRRASERTWLCRIARNVALDHFRAESRRRRREERFAVETTDRHELDLDGFSPELADALRSLSAGEREVLALRIVLDLDAETAAAFLGVGRTTCSMRLARALAKLEERMEAHANV